MKDSSRGTEGITLDLVETSRNGMAIGKRGYITRDSRVREMLNEVFVTRVCDCGQHWTT